MNNIKYTGDLVNNSKTTGVEASDDRESPFAYGQWLLYSKSLSTSYDEYKKYLAGWSKTHTTATEESTVREQYITYLKQLTLNHLFTDDETRYLNTADLTNRYEAEAASSIYARKLKQTCDYIQQQRVKTKQSKDRLQHYATVDGVGSVIYNDILNILKDVDFQTKYKDVLIELDKMFNELRVELVELYDIEDGYTGTSSIDINSKNYSLAQQLNNIEYDPNIFISPTTAMANIVNKYSILSDIQVDDSAISITFDSSQAYLVDLLPPHEYSNYVTELENLNIKPMQDLVKKTTGADTYYIKTDENANVSDTGLLFESTDKTGNIYNKQKPHLNIVSNDDTKTKTIYEIGGFFTPDRLGVVTYTSIDPKITIDKEKLKPNTIYTYPDAKSLGDTPRDSTTPLTYQESATWIKKEDTDNHVSDIQDQSNYQKFYNYISSDEYNKYSVTGISRKDDPFDFWTDDVSDVWSNADVYDTDETSKLPIDSRQQDQLINQGQPFNWRSDIYGNEYALLKNMISYNEELFDMDECDKDKYQDGLICRIFDGADFKDILKGLSIYESCIDGGSDTNVTDISKNLTLLTAAGMKCNESTCPVGTRWEELNTSGELEHISNINGFQSPPDYTDLANASYFLPELCLEQQEESARLYNCNIIDGYTIKIPQGYQENDVYELTASYYGVESPPTFTAQDGPVFNPPYDNLWDCGDFQTQCTDIPQEEFYDIDETEKFIDDVETVPTSFEESANIPTLPNHKSRQEKPGSLIIRNNNSKFIEPHSTVLEDIIDSLPEKHTMIYSDDDGLTEQYKDYNPREEMKSELLDIDVIIDVLILRTRNFVYVVKISYDYETDSIEIDKTHTLLIGLDYKSVLVKHFYCEKEDTIIIGSYLKPVKASASNPVPTFKPQSIYTIPVSSSTLHFHKLSFPTSGYILPDNVDTFSPGECIVSYNEQLKLYYITCIGRLHDSVYGDRFFTYQSRFAPVARHSPNLIAFEHKIYYTTSLDYNQTETLKDVFGVETLETDDKGFNYYELNEFLNDDYKTDQIPYNELETRMQQKDTKDFSTGTPTNPTRIGDFSALFVPEAVNTFYFKLNIDPNNILPDYNSPVYRIEAKFHRPDISSTHIDTISVNRNPLPNFSDIDISRIPDGNDLADPRQFILNYEYNFERSPDKCINNSADCTTPWDFGQRHVGELYKFAIIAHTSDGVKHIYTYKFILKPFDAGTSLTDINLISTSSYVDQGYNECTLMILESSKPRLTTPVVLRTRSLIKERYNQDELLSFNEYVVPNTKNSINTQAFTSQIDQYI